MKTTLTLATAGLLACSSWAATSQTVLPPTYPFNPDSDGDEFVAVSDVLSSVAAYDNEFQASPLMVDTLTLEQAIQILLQRQEQNQQDLINGLSNSLAGVDGFDPCLLQWTCGCPVEYNGYSYSTVQIGDQCWFAENLRTELYANGDSIPMVLEDAFWDWPPVDSLYGARAVYGLGTSETVTYGDGTPEENLATFGYFYNSSAVFESRGLCPSGWHVPTIDEAYELREFAGGYDVAGGKLKATGNLADGSGLWNSPNVGATNELGFGALPAGIRVTTFQWRDGYTWIQTQSHAVGNPEWHYRIKFASDTDNFIIAPDVHPGLGSRQCGASVRCLKD
ncbi:MAG: fibrobacter succinogenes major paralogous domain-containing protein [Bacteroidetes bacterium]|nr:fibrobacter succinogenes major paralogous domain-containing protein [Bacteroidota bacterium]